MCTCIPFLLKLPPTPSSPTPLGHCRTVSELPVLCSSFPLAIHSAHASVYMSTLLSQCIPSLSFKSHDWKTRKFLRQFILHIFISCCCYSIAKSYPPLCNPKDCSMPGFSVLRYLLEFAQSHVHWVGDAIPPSFPLSPSSLPALNLSHHQSLFQWVNSSHEVAKVL